MLCVLFVFLAVSHTCVNIHIYIYTSISMYMCLVCFSFFLPCPDLSVLMFACVCVCVLCVSPFVLVKSPSNCNEGFLLNYVASFSVLFGFF